MIVDRSSLQMTLRDLNVDSDDGITTAQNRYPGGKNAPGIYQRLISLMPPHAAYIEPFLGSGSIMRRKRRASRENLGIDADHRVFSRFPRLPGVNVVCGDAREILRGRDWLGDELIYADPPYLGSARRAGGQRRIYRCELMSAPDHERLLDLLTSIPAMVMISGYPSPLYEERLAGWSRVEYDCQTRRGTAREVVWFNFPTPVVLHDYRYLGSDYHDRLRIRRKIARIRAKLADLPALERAAVIDGIDVAAGQ